MPAVVAAFVDELFLFGSLFGEGSQAAWGGFHEHDVFCQFGVELVAGQRGFQAEVLDRL